MPQQGHASGSNHDDHLLEGGIGAAGAAEVATWCLTGMSGWWGLNVISAELPYFVAELPEAAGLGNLIGVCTQLGNVAPIAYKALHRHDQRHLTYMIAAFQGLAVITLLASAAFWDVTIGGHSAVLLLCTALTGSVGCMSNVTYWAAANARPAACTRAMSVGMTLGGLLATGLSSCQMAGRQHGDPRFSPTLLFATAGVVQALMGAAFLGQARTAARRTAQGHQEAPSPTSAGGVAEAGPAELPAARGKVPLPAIGKVLFCAMFVMYGATYTMPTVQPYIAGGYESATDRQQLLLAMLVLQNAGDVLGRMATAFIRGGGGVLSLWAVVLSLIFVAAVVFAAQSHQMSVALPYDIAVWVVPSLCGVYYFGRGLLVTALYLRARMLGDASVVQRLSLNMGFYGQMGALVANALTFVLVTILHVFG